MSSYLDQTLNFLHDVTPIKDGFFATNHCLGAIDDCLHRSRINENSSCLNRSVCIFALLHKATPIDKPQLSYMVSKLYKILSYIKR